MEEKPEHEAHSQFVTQDSQDDTRPTEPYSQFVIQDDSQPTESDIDHRNVLSTAAFPVPSDIPTNCSYDYNILQNVMCDIDYQKTYPKTLQAFKMGTVLMIALSQVC